jgi:hypothetical protein
LRTRDVGTPGYNQEHEYEYHRKQLLYRRFRHLSVPLWWGEAPGSQRIAGSVVSHVCVVDHSGDLGKRGFGHLERS